MSGQVIRPYRDSDLEAVALLFTASVHDLTCSHYDSIQRAAWAPQPPDLHRWRNRLAGVNTLIALVGADLAGFISYENSGHIDLLYTSPRHARRGVAFALYGEAEADLAANGVSKLYTEASMTARPFFERVGFEVVEDQLVELRGVPLRRHAMRKQLSS